MEVANAEGATLKAHSLLAAFRQQNKVIVHIQHISTRENATFFLPNTRGIEIHKSVLPLPHEKIISKHFPNSFRDTDLEEFLQENGVQEIIFCGMMSHMCIDATVRAAFDKGYTCIVADDACATRNLTHNEVEVQSTHVQASFMAALAAVYARVTPTAQIIAEITM